MCEWRVQNKLLGNEFSSWRESCWMYGRGDMKHNPTFCQWEVYLTFTLGLPIWHGGRAVISIIAANLPIGLTQCLKCCWWLMWPITRVADLTYVLTQYASVADLKCCWWMVCRQCQGLLIWHFFWPNIQVSPIWSVANEWSVTDVKWCWSEICSDPLDKCCRSEVLPMYGVLLMSRIADLTFLPTWYTSVANLKCCRWMECYWCQAVLIWHLFWPTIQVLRIWSVANEWSVADVKCCWSDIGSNPIGQCCWCEVLPMNGVLLMSGIADLTFLPTQYTCVANLKCCRCMECCRCQVLLIWHSFQPDIHVLPIWSIADEWSVADVKWCRSDICSDLIDQCCRCEVLLMNEVLPMSGIADLTFLPTRYTSVADLKCCRCMECCQCQMLPIWHSFQPSRPVSPMWSVADEWSVSDVRYCRSDIPSDLIYMCCQCEVLPMYGVLPMSSVADLTFVPTQ